MMYLVIPFNFPPLNQDVNYEGFCLSGAVHLKQTSWRVDWVRNGGLSEWLLNCGKQRSHEEGVGKKLSKWKRSRAKTVGVDIRLGRMSPKGSDKRRSLNWKRDLYISLKKNRDREAEIDPTQVLNGEKAKNGSIVSLPIFFPISHWRLSSPLPFYPIDWLHSNCPGEGFIFSGGKGKRRRRRKRGKVNSIDHDNRYKWGQQQHDWKQIIWLVCQTDVVVL